LTGTTPVKVSLENGVISKGDLLTTSSTPGVAMKATSRTAGTLGVALTSFDPAGVCRADLTSAYEAELAASGMDLTIEEKETLLTSLDFSACESVEEFGEVSALIGISNPVVTESGSVVTIIDDQDQTTTLDLAVTDYEEFGNVVVKGETIFGGKITVAKPSFWGMWLWPAV
jgi:hypothetical protein